MEAKTINAGNKSITEFMGIVLKGGGESINKSNPELKKYFRITTYETDGLCRECGNGPSHGHKITCYTLNFEALKYHEDWKLLMPVVEKIESLKYTSVYTGKTYLGEFHIEINYDPPSHKCKKTVFIKDKSLTKHEATWLAVVEFIEWYKNLN
jgi:hypothetical protein